MSTLHSDFWQDRPVLVTGHTGFKGGWLSLRLAQAGARVTGYALDPPTTPSFFAATKLAQDVRDIRGDLADLPRLRATLKQGQPEVIFHLAAQPLVRQSYEAPVATLRDNVIGTAHVLEAARNCPSVRAVVCVTTDKVYANDERGVAFAEHEPLGGKDPYSASKAASEIIVNSYRCSFLAPAGIHLASARAGNVIGGGDWAADRLVPDCVRAFSAGQPVEIRSPQSVRPWQHVLESLSGYLSLAEAMLGERGADFATGWNFGPSDDDHRTVGEVTKSLADLWGNASVQVTPGDTTKPEAGLLRLDSKRARSLLGWKPKWDVETTLQATCEWYKAFAAGADMRALSIRQLQAYVGV